MEILSLITELEEIIEDASTIPFSSKIVIDKEEIAEIIRKINVSIPEEVRKAKWIKEEKDHILLEAKKEAEEILRTVQDEQDRLIEHARFEENKVIEDARALADTLICDNEITLLAEKHCSELVKEAERKAENIKTGAYKYADTMLSDLQEKLDSFSETINYNRSELNKYVTRNEE